MFEQSQSGRLHFLIWLLPVAGLGVGCKGPYPMGLSVGSTQVTSSVSTHYKLIEGDSPNVRL